VSSSLFHELAPADEHNRLLLAHAHPGGWINPTPAGRYNLVAIGGGTAGIVCALEAAKVGGRAALVERHLLGGNRLNYGCVPSKALVRAARAAYEVRHAAEFGQSVSELPAFDFPATMERMRRLRAKISHRDSAEHLKSLGIDVYLGQATFTGPRTVTVEGRTLEFRRAAICTGARPVDPEIEGLPQVGYLTNETVFSLTELPRRLIVVGAGPLGCELAQCFRRFGSEVHLVERRDTLLAREDPLAAVIIREQFVREGIHLHLSWTPLEAKKTGDSKSLILARDGEKKELIADEILVGVGRTANVQDLGLEAAGVEYTPAGVMVNDRLQTSNPRIYAAGDVCSRQQFTHAAEAMARLCIQNALCFRRKKVSSLVIPRCTYTDPEVAHVGLTPAEAAQEGLEIDTYREDFSRVDRAILDSQEQGFATIHTRRGTGRVVGATIVAAHAGEMIAEVTLLMQQRLPLGVLCDVIHCYPTQVEVLKRIADAYQRTRSTPRLSGMLSTWLRWQR
jgi:pyruvate/2-oxoglutarate dehydrogenase complex dihydrolipoamide dehydrogenase (E3) component